MNRGDRINFERMKPGLLRTACKALDDVLRAKGWDDAELSRQTGCPLATIHFQRRRGFPSRRTRARIEGAFRAPIWSKPAEFVSRQRQKELLGGIDPTFITREQLRSLAKATQLPGWSDLPNRKQFISRLCDHIEARPHLRRIISTSTSNSIPRHD